jgi:hypothetical protein
MRALFVLIVLILLLSLAGWLVIDFQGSTASVEVKTEKIQSDADALIDKSKQLLHKADEQLNPK